MRGAGSARPKIIEPWAAALLTACLVACTVPAPASSAPGADARILVKLAQPSEDKAAIAAAAARLAGVPVDYAASVSAQWHALYLHCPDAAACDAAIERLRRSGNYAAVEADLRKRRAVM